MGDPFGQVETEHMPLFTGLAALVSPLASDPQIGAECIAVLCGAGTVALTVWIGMRWFSPAVGLLAGLLLCFQPESALYSATPLRESLYTVTMMGGVALVGSRRLLLGALLLSVAFLARFNIAFSILPALALWVLGPRSALRPKERNWGLIAIALVTATVLAWAAYYHSQEGVWTFWAGVMDRNTGNAVTDLFVGERFRASFGAVFGLLFMVLPTHIGWAVVPLGILGGLKLTTRSLANAPAAAWLTLCGAGTLALLLATAVVSTYEWQHNLYWKWLTPAVPYFCILGIHGACIAGEWVLEHPLFARTTLHKLPAASIWMTGALILLGASLNGYAGETERQLRSSSRTYGTQVRLAQWVEEAWPEGTRVLTWAYSIPAAYLQRMAGQQRVLDWNAPGIPGDDPAAFGAWLLDNRVAVVIWYSEEGTGGPNTAGYLSSGEAQQLGPVHLEPLVNERSYGTIAYQVLAPGIAKPEHTPSPAWFEGRAE
jgi:hypothetical protein